MQPRFQIQLYFVRRSSATSRPEILEGVQLFPELYPGGRSYMEISELPQAGTILWLSAGNQYWIVSLAVRSIEEFEGVLSSTLLLCETDLFFGFPFRIYTGLNPRLVGRIGSDFVFQPLCCTEDSGYEWGYEGAGPRHLSKSILFDHCGSMPDESTEIAFSQQVVRHMPRGQPFVISASEIEEWLRKNSISRRN